MPKRTRRFIDKKNAVTFQLVHRSQRDPLITDENAPQRVLKPIEGSRNDELEKYGIFYDDDYDYMQHLRTGSGTTALLAVERPIQQKKEDTRIVLPSSVFASEVEERVGVLNKAAPRGLDLSLDPDIVAAMDSDYDYDDSDNEFDEDFVKKLNSSHKDVSGEDIDESVSDEHDDMVESDEEYYDVEDEEMDEVRSLRDVETQSRFTDYSMTSSVIRRNEQLRFLDDRFEEMFAGYNETEIGALDCEEIEGDLDPKNAMVLQIADEFENTRKTGMLETEHTGIHESESDSSDSEHSLVEVKDKKKWDCESILSLYSNIYNHPKIIDAPPFKIKINPKTGMPETKVRLTAKALAALNGDNELKKSGPRSLASAVSALSIRPPNERPEERKERKQAFRLHKQERRIEKKLNTVAFKEEKRKMEKMMANNKSSHTVKI